MTLALKSVTSDCKFSNFLSNWISIALVRSSSLRNCVFSARTKWISLLVLQYNWQFFIAHSCISQSFFIDWISLFSGSYLKRVLLNSFTVFGINWKSFKGIVTCLFSLVGLGKFSYKGFCWTFSQSFVVYLLTFSLRSFFALNVLQNISQVYINRRV